MTTTPLRQRLHLLTAAGILPLAIMAGISLSALLGQQRGQAERVGLELARSVANAVEAELRSSVAILETLATAPALDEKDLEAFRERAERVIDARGAWASIVLTSPDGSLLVDTRTRGGTPPLGHFDVQQLDRVVRHGTPAVGGLMPQARGDWLFAVHVPVLRQGTVPYVVTALIRPDAIRAVLTRQQVPGDWVISIVDANGLRVARSRAHEENLGGRLSETVQQLVASGALEGFGITYTLEGERVFTPYSRSASTGWIAVLGIPTSLADAAALSSVGIYGGGILLSIALATAGALWVARTIARPMAELRSAAEALGRREAPRTPETRIQEIGEVGTALAQAANALTRGEAEREELLRKERLAREAAEAADRAKDQFMAVLSHELRTPLNAVYGWARMLQDGQVQDAATAARATDAIVRNAEVQVQLIDDLLDLSRISSGKMRLEIGQVALDGVLQGALDAVRPAADAKGIRLVTELDPNAGPLTGDPARLQQIFWNLLMNAVKFTPRGGEVRVRLQCVDTSVAVTVSDTGQGIAPHVLPHVFERFRQADGSSTRTHGGLGLGLALVRHLVELHGGSVSAHSAGEGRGATFTVMLPRATADTRVETMSRETPGGLHASMPLRLVRLDGLRVLVVDDDTEALRLSEAILTSAGATVRTCGSAASALELLRRWRPDVLVSDIEMPGEDGFSLIERIRALGHDSGGETPALALSAYGRVEDRMRALSAGFTMHVPKPIDPGELTAIISGLASPPGRPDRSPPLRSTWPEPPPPDTAP